VANRIQLRTSVLGNARGKSDCAMNIPSYVLLTCYRVYYRKFTRKILESRKDHDRTSPYSRSSSIEGPSIECNWEIAIKRKKEKQRKPTDYERFTSITSVRPSDLMAGGHPDRMRGERKPMEFPPKKIAFPRRDRNLRATVPRAETGTAD